MRKKRDKKTSVFLFFIPLILKVSYPLKLSKKILFGKILKYKIVTYYVNYFKILSKKQYFNKIINIINIILIIFPRVLQSYVN